MSDSQIAQSEPKEVRVEVLRKLMQKYVDTYIEQSQESDRRKIGKILTVIDASMSDPQQRKAIKDIIQNDWYSHNEFDFAPAGEMRKLAEALEFELWPQDPNAEPLSNATIGSYNRYKDLTK